jgi:hypothetical protein
VALCAVGAVGIHDVLRRNGGRRVGYKGIVSLRIFVLWFLFLSFLEVEEGRKESRKCRRIVLYIAQTSLF